MWLSASLFIPRHFLVEWLGCRRKCVIEKKCAEGVARACIFASGLERRDVYLGGSGG